MTSDAEPDSSGPEQSDAEVFAALAAQLVDQDLVRIGVRLRALELQRLRLARFLPANAIAVTATAMVPTPWTQALVPLVAGAGGGTAAAFYVECARLARQLRRTQSRLLEEGRTDRAAHVALARCQLLELLPTARIRQAVAAVDAMRLAARAGQAELIVNIGSQLRPTFSVLSARARHRVAGELADFATDVESWPTAVVRVAGRAAIGFVAEMAKLPGSGRYAAALAIDLYSASEEAAANLIGPGPQIGALFGTEVPAAMGEEFISWTVQTARRVMAEGLTQVLQDEGSDPTDQLVRSVVAADRMPVATLLDAYREAMDRCDDPRAATFAALLADPDPEKAAALAVIGVARPAPGIDPLER